MGDGGGRSARGDPAGRQEPAVDVPLTGADTTSGDPPDGRPATSWTGFVVIALAGGAALGIAIAAMRAGNDHGDTGRAGAGDETVPEITIERAPRALETSPPSDGVEGSDGSTGSTGTPGAPSPPAAVIAPTYPAANEVASGEVGYDIAAAVDRNDDDIARRSDTHVELGYGGYVLDVSIVRDPERDRYQIELESRGDVEQVIVDLPTGVTYIDPGTEDEIRISNDDITGNSDAGAYFDRLLHGPVRPDTYDAAATQGRGVVTIDGVGDAREFVTTVAGELAPEWQIYAFGPVREFLPSDRPDELTYSVYVDEAGRIVQVDGVAMLDDVPQLVRHRVTVLDEPIAVTLPNDTRFPERTTDDGG